MKFWDSSAIVPLLIVERSSQQLEMYLADDRRVAAWWATPVECVSAIGREERAGRIDGEEAARGVDKLNAIGGAWVEVAPSRQIRDTARRLVRLHELRAGDALQLAAAWTASGARPESLPFVTLDERLAAAVRREGFPVLP